MVDGLNGLGLHPVIGGYNKDDDVRHVRPPGSHGAEGGVAGCVQKGDLLFFFFLCRVREYDGVRANVLGDAAGLTGYYIGLSQRVEQGCFAVVDMAHHGDHRGSGF